MAGFPCISITMQAGDLHSPGVGFWSFADNGLKMVRRNDKARSERALSERFERGLETTIYLYGASGGIRTHDPSFGGQCGTGILVGGKRPKIPLSAVLQGFRL